MPLAQVLWAGRIMVLPFLKLGNSKGSGRGLVQWIMFVGVSTLRISVSWRLLTDWLRPADDRAIPQ
jgi:hypothetical protein